MESTDIYNELFAILAHKLGFIVFVLNPKDARYYAKGVGLRGKIDRVYVEMLAGMISHEHTNLHIWITPTPEQCEIDRLNKHRAKLSVLRQILDMSLKGMDGFKTDLNMLKNHFDQVIAHIDKRVNALVDANPDRKEHVRHLRTIYGVGTVVNTALVNTLERTPLKTADAFVAFTGLDPRPDNSGQHRGKRRLSKRDSSELRRLLYLIALSAIKTKTWRPIYEHYRGKGLSSTATVIILARRIVRTACLMYTYKTEFDPGQLTKCLT